MRTGLFNHSLVFLFIFCFSPPVRAQTCPQQVDDFILDNNSSDNGKISSYRSDRNREKIFGCDCSYKDISTGTRKIFTRTYWVETSDGAAAFGFNNMCNPDPQAIPSRFVDPKYEVYHSGKAVYSRFTVSGPNSTANSATARKIAGQMISMVEGKAAFCKSASNANGFTGNSNNSWDNTEFCRQKSERLSQLQEKKSGISDQLKTLESSSFNEATNRTNLSYYSKLVAALNTPGYNGDMFNEVNRFLHDAGYRAREAIRHGVNPDASAIKIVRTIRDMIVARIDYFKDAPVFIQRSNKELIDVNAEIESIQGEMARRQCHSDFNIKSCNLSGEWIFSIWDEEDGWYKEVWKFTPVTKGEYSAFNNRTGKNATASVFGHHVIFKIDLGLGNIMTDTYKFGNDACNSGEGKSNIHGYSTRLTVERIKPARNSFVQDKLYDITFNGNNYQGMYQREKDKGVPIDVFFFPINHITGYQVEQDGQKLWGRFVRKPATDHTDQSTVQWWFSNWVPENGQWVKKDEKISSPPTIR